MDGDDRVWASTVDGDAQIIRPRDDMGNRIHVRASLGVSMLLDALSDRPFILSSHFKRDLTVRRYRQ
jgi:hypothetical protein